MSEQNEAFQNPFSKEKAWMTFQDNMTEAARLRDEILKGKEEGSASEKELLLKATEALGRLTDNTILKRIVEKALDARENT